MSLHQLIVHDDDDVVTLALDAVKHSLGAQANVFYAHNLEMAEKLLSSLGANNNWSLVVVGASTPESRFSRGQSQGKAARDFIRRLKTKHPSLPVIALVVEQQPELEGLLSAYEESTAIVPFNLDWRSRLIEEVTNLMRYGTRVLGSRLDLEIELYDNNIGVRRLRRGRDEIQSGFMFDEAKLRMLRRGYGADGTSFLEWMEDMSDKLNDCLFRGSEQNMKFWQQFVDWRAAVGGTENTRIRFTMMTTDTHDVVFEALKDQPGNDYWMLKAPIVRQYNVVHGTSPLFSDDASRRGPINCLIVDADPAAGEISEGQWQSQTLDELVQSRTEAESVKRILEEMRDVGHSIDDVQTLHLNGHGDDPVSVLYDRLADKRGPWHIVHFIGHGVISPNGAAGLVLAANTGAVLPFDALTAKLKGTQFLFISSCRSANSAFLTHATRSLVPAVLGYRWRVDDWDARHFAEFFYRALFEHGRNSFKSLEYAFLRARCCAFDKAPNRVTWASPLLLTQLSREP